MPLPESRAWRPWYPCSWPKCSTVRITLTDLIRKTVTAPAALLGIPPAGFAPGDRADFALYPQSTVTSGAGTSAQQVRLDTV